MRNIPWNADRAAKYWGRFCSNDPEMYNREMAECEKHLSDVIATDRTSNPFTLKKNRSPVWGMFINLQGMAAFLGSRSFARLLKNDLAGWEDVQHSSLLWYWAERIGARMSLADNRGGARQDAMSPAV